MRLQSPAFITNSQIPLKYSCEGQNLSPPLEILGVPENTKSLVLVVEDPDAPAKPWVHWLVFNISPQVTSIPEGLVPQGGIEGLNSSGTNKYDGPCPPQSAHHYLFHLYAVDRLIDVPATAERKEVLEAMEGHILDQDTLIGIYQLSDSVQKEKNI